MTGYYHGGKYYGGHYGGHDDDDCEPGTGKTPDGYVDGTAGGELIDAAYESDPDGDMIDAGDALLPGETGDDDIVRAGGGDDTILSGNGDDEVFAGSGDDVVDAGAGNDVMSGGLGDDDLQGGTGNDVIYGDSGQAPEAVRESFEWDKLPDPNYCGGAIDHNDPLNGTLTQDTGQVNVTFTQTKIGTPETTYCEVDGVTSGIQDDGNGVDANSTMSSFLNANGESATYKFGFSQNVDDVSFRINDIDYLSKVTIRAYDANGNLVDIQVDAGSLVSAYDMDSAGGTETLLSSNANAGGADSNPNYSALVTIPGPVTRIEITHTQVGSGSTGITVSDIFYDVTPIDDGSVTTAADGNDLIDGGSGDDTIFGEGGDDTVVDGAGADLSYGGADRDTFIGGSAGDHVDGGEAGIDEDTLDLRGMKVIVEYTPGDPEAGTVSFLDDDDNVTGTMTFVNIETVLTDPIDPDPQLDGYVEGTADGDLIDAGYEGDPEGDMVDNDDAILAGDSGDDDVILAYSGDDTVIAGEGRDEVYGGAGNDLLDGGIDNDTLVGDYGHDELIGGGGQDLLYGNQGNDRLYGGDDADSLFGGSGDDVLEGGQGADSLVGGAGNDSLNGGNGEDTLEGGAGNDTLIGGSGTDEIHGGSGEDTIRGGTSEDHIEGGAGNDHIAGDAGADLILAGSGNDTVFGGSGNDTIYGDSGDDLLYGSDQEDEVHGGAGSDTIFGSANADLVYGGADRDSIVGASTGDYIDGGSSGDDYDTLDLTGYGVPGGHIKINYTSADKEDGIVEFYNPDNTLAGTAEFHDIENVVPCFTPGTLIATPRGEVPVEELQEGDRVITRDNGMQQIRWKGSRQLKGEELLKAKHLQPVLIRRGALGYGLPERDMVVSPNHRMLINNDKTALYFEDREVLVAAKHLTGLAGIERLQATSTTYVHFLFDQHEVILSDGAWSETFQPGHQTMDGLGNAQRNEIFEVFPELRQREGQEAYHAARTTLKRHEAELLTLG